LGARSLDEIIGRADLLAQVECGWQQADQFDLSSLLQRVDGEGDAIRYTRQSSGRGGVGEFNSRLLKEAAPALEHRLPVVLSYPITNHDRTVGATLSGEIATRYGPAGLPEGTITVSFRGSAGQSFGAFLAPGLRLLLEGEANDYVGKGMAGGEIVVRSPSRAAYVSHKSVLAGNTVLYGATGGALYLAGRAGERFAVRNSGAIAVAEGVGDHGCEYMTGGVVLLLGQTGRNFAAGMTGGLAYVFDEDGTLAARCNQDTIDLGPLNEHDEEDVLTLILRHLELTGSRRADELLLGWNVVRDRFRRVQPRGVAAARVSHPLLRVLRPAPNQAEPLEDGTAA
jgi:glutamate synthase (ferredoxin)